MADNEEEQVIADAIEALEDLNSDNTVPKNIKTKIDDIVSALKEETELSIRLNRALNDLDEISDNSNIQPYTRTQIWNIVSILEAVNR